jgi:SagB-type dehydrogenase family enzyme
MPARRRDVVLLAALAAAGCTGSAGCSASTTGSTTGSAAGTATAGPPARTRAVVESLPSPDRTGTVPLEQVLAARHSVRDFSGRPLGRALIGQLFWAAQGITHGERGRPAPSAGALYPLELYAVTSGQVLHYLPQGHRAQRWTVPQARHELARASGGQSVVGAAPVVLVVTAVLARTAGKYGSRAQRYVDLEAGHAAQDVLLQACAAGLGAVPIGSFDDDQVAQVLDLATDEAPRYLIPVGFPA